MFDDARVVARGEPRRTGSLREREQLGETERAVAGDARIWRVATGVAAHERADNGAAELVAQVERDVRQTKEVAGLPRVNHRARGAAGALAVRPVGIDPQPQRHAESVRAGPQKGNGAVHPAAPCNGDTLGVRLGVEYLPEP